MDAREIAKIVSAVTKECYKNFDRHKDDDYTLASLTIIPFVSKPVSTRKVSDWGTDEDRDEFIWFSRNGWQYADMTVQTGAGVNQVIESNISEITEQRVVEILSTWNLSYQMEFVSQAYSILQQSEFKSELD